MGVCLSKKKKNIRANNANDCFDSLQELSHILNERIAAEHGGGLNRRENETSLDGVNQGDCERCTVVCDGREYPVRIKSLCDSSPYFTAMFNCHMKEANSKRIEIKEVDPEMLEITLRFIQYSVLPDMQVEELISLLCISNMFLMADLYMQCCCLAEDVMSVENYQEFWEVCRLQQTEALSNLIINFIAKNFLEVKNEIKRVLDVEEMALLVKILKLNQFIVNNDVKNFITDWIVEDGPNRRHFKDILYFLSGLNQLKFSDVASILDKKHLYPKVVLNNVTEIFALENLKILLMNRYDAVWFYSLHHDKLLKLIVHSENRNKFEYICGSINEHVFVFKRRFVSATETVSLDVLKCHVHTGSIQVLPQLHHYASNLQVTVNNDTPYVIYKTYERDSPGIYERYIMQYFSSAGNRWILIEPNSRYSSVDTIISIEDNICTLGRDSRGRDLLERFAISSEDWHSMKCPPKQEKEKGGIATSCLGELYFVCHPQVVDRIPWNIGSPKPSRIQKHEIDGVYHVRYVSYCTQTDCEVLSKEKRFLRYDIAADNWVEIRTTGGPAGIAQILKGPHDYRIRNPHIYVIDDDNCLHQFDPRLCFWKMLYEFPRSFRMLKGHSDYSPLSALSY